MRRGAISSTSAALPQYQDAFALSPDHRTLYFTAFGEEGGAFKELLALDTRYLRVAWRERLADLATRSSVGNVRVWGANMLAASSDGTKLLLDGQRDDTIGVVVADLRSRTPIGFAGPIVSGLRATASVPPATLLIGGTRYLSHEEKSGYLYMFDDVTLELLDSVAVGLTVDQRGGIKQLLPSPDGRHIYIVTLDSLFKFDQIERRFVASGPRPVPYRGARLAIAPNGQTLYTTDPGDGRDSPGSGMLHVLGPDLEPLEPVDLGGSAKLVVTHAAAVSPNGSLIYITSGTASRGPLYGSEPSRLLIVDAEAGKLVRQVPLPDWLVREILVY